ncbi:MAG: hypothetical protein ACO1SV_02880 [Fimbriimonas sp.]
MFGAPESFVDLLILPVLAVIFSLLLRLGAWGRDRQGGGAKSLKIAAFIAATLGLFVGIQNLWAMFNPDTGYLYVKTIDGKKVLFSHYLSFLLPLCTLIGLIVWARVEKKLGHPISI